MHIDREDMLELTRRMTVSRNCFSRIAGAYMDEEGFIDGTFNTHFLKLSGSEKREKSEYCQDGTLFQYQCESEKLPTGSGARKPGSIMQLLEALRQCELKNDALLYSLYEYIGERYQPGYPYAVYLFLRQLRCTHQGKRQREPVGVRGSLSVSHRHDQSGDRRLRGRKTGGGILYPAFANHSTDIDGINIYQAEEGAQLFAKILGVRGLTERHFFPIIRSGTK